MINHTKQTIISVEADDLQKLIEETYGYRYEIVADMELSNDDLVESNVEKDELMDYDQNEVDEYGKTGRGSFLLHKLMQDLCNKNLLIPGKYLIRVS